MCDGIGDELNGIDLGDKGLNKRSKRIIEALAANPEASINGACSGWTDTIAAYRFMDNPSVTPNKLCLGVLGVEFLERTPESLGKSEERKSWPIEQKESYRWWKGYRVACALSYLHESDLLLLMHFVPKRQPYHSPGRDKASGASLVAALGIGSASDLSPKGTVLVPHVSLVNVESMSATDFTELILWLSAIYIPTIPRAPSMLAELALTRPGL